MLIIIKIQLDLAFLSSPVAFNFIGAIQSIKIALVDIQLLTINLKRKTHQRKIKSINNLFFRQQFIEFNVLMLEIRKIITFRNDTSKTFFTICNFMCAI